ncbi:MAG TPA: alpha/beta hydrolase-fold protein [Terracidiphilus sp.]|nr:alpha/beta hydrolase-fold protein [Terracidiphilus sp.]
MAPLAAHAAARAGHPKNFQETGFLNRTIEFRGAEHRFQVYLPEEWRRDDHRQWPIILFLHGRGERGSEGMWQTQIGLPEALRDHPERWPFIVVMPQCPQRHYWTDPEMMSLAMAVLDQETKEFHADSTRTYLTGLSLGGYGAWELARTYPQRWAAIAIAAGSVFWSYAPERWHDPAALTAEYARAVGRTPVWIFHGGSDPVVSIRGDEQMYDTFKAEGGHIRYWVYLGLGHDCWSRAFNEPDLPRWLLSHRRDPKEEPGPFFERIVIPLHPAAIRLTQAQLESFAGDYDDEHGRLGVTLFRQGDQLYQRDIHGEVAELAAESVSLLFYPNGSSITRIAVERDSEGRIIALTLRDDRHEERWERRSAQASR